MAVCGLWHTGRRLVGVIVDDEGHAASTALTAATDDERWEMLRNLDEVHGLNSELVVPEPLVRSDVICHFALERRQVTWAAPQVLIEAIRRTASVKGPAATAAMIARLALVPAFRQHLRRVQSIGRDWRQLSLL